MVRGGWGGGGLPPERGGHAPAWGAAGFTVIALTLNALLQLDAIAGAFCALTHAAARRIADNIAEAKSATTVVVPAGGPSTTTTSTTVNKYSC